MKKKYPLEQLVFIKKKKLQEAEKMLREKKEELEAEEEKLVKVEAERDKVKVHKMEKLTQLREALDEGKPAAKIEEMRIYLKIVDEKLKSHENKVILQQKEVEKAEEAVEEARKEMLKRQRDVEKLKEHKGDWTKEMVRELEREEAKEGDEMGTTRYIRNKKKRH